MTIEVATSKMVSEETPHAARCAGEGQWVVSWLPGRSLTFEQAITAMTIATTLANRPDLDLSCPGPGPVDDPDWAMVRRWALQLGLSGREAAGMVLQENHSYL